MTNVMLVFYLVALFSLSVFTSFGDMIGKNSFGSYLPYP